MIVKLLHSQPRQPCYLHSYAAWVLQSGLHDLCTPLVQLLSVFDVMQHALCCPVSCYKNRSVARLQFVAQVAQTQADSHEHQVTIVSAHALNLSLIPVSFDH